MKKAYVGMPIHFYEFPTGTHKGPFAGFITWIWPDDYINVVGFDAHGSQFTAQGIELIGEDDKVPQKESYARWIVEQDMETDSPGSIEGNTQLNAVPVTAQPAPSPQTSPNVQNTTDKFKIPPAK